ncbi:dual specificity protein phosphatase 10 [Trichomycterus rosablanca]|uniref:dual specificity protein phosphatase 10 n=1 Tax=Trichomycterus rosablanca TaxID=2290929 RepID=UPI002F35DEC9
MPPLPLDERIVVIQRPKSLALCVASPPATSQYSSRLTTRHEPPSRSPQTQRPPPRTHPPSNSLSLECRHRNSPLGQRAKGERSATTEDSSWIPSHCHSNGIVTLGPRPSKHTHTIDIKVSVDKGGVHLDKRQSIRESKAKQVPSHLISGQSDRVPRGKLYDTAENHQNKALYSNHYQNNLTVSPGGVLEFVPAHRQQSKHKWTEEELSKSRFTTASYRDVPSLGDKENSKLGTIHQPPKSYGLPRHHSSVQSAHASILNTHYQAAPNSFRAPSSFHPVTQTRSSRIKEPHSQILHSLPLSATSSPDGFPSPDHTCTIDFSHPFSCNCWRLICCTQGRGHSAGCQGGTGSPSTSISQKGSTAKKGDGAMGLKTLGGCISTASTTNTSSSNSTVSDCRTGILRPLGCSTCSGDDGSPAAFRKKLVGGCLPCSPFSASSPLRALQSCVSGCNPTASQTGSSTCSYCSSDPIVVTYNPHRGKPPGTGYSTGTMGGYQPDDDDYSVRTIWPDELAKKMTRSKSQPNHQSAGMRMGTGKPYMGHEANSSNGSNPVILDCRNLLEFTRSQLIDNAGRRRLQQGKMAVMDFMGSGRDYGQDSLKRLCNKDEDAGLDNDDGLDDMLPNSSFPHCLTPESSLPYSPLPSAPSTLIKPKPRGREWEGGHSLPSAQSLHLALNSFNREQNEENMRLRLSLPLSSSLPASLSDESVMTPDVENAVISPILPFLFLGNERDAQDLDLLLRLNISYVVNVTTHLPLYHLNTGLVRYKRLPATDNSKQNLRQYFEEVFEFIEEAHQSGRGVLVHCQAGVSRSATIVIAYLMKHTLMTMTDAYKYVRSRRPVVSPNLNFMGQLLEFERDLNSGVTPRILTPKLSGVETQV